MDGVIVDLDIRLLGVNDPTIIMGQYLPDPITKDFNVLTLFPRVTGINYQAKDNWQIKPFLVSMPAWMSKARLNSPSP